METKNSGGKQDRDEVNLVDRGEIRNSKGKQDRDEFNLDVGRNSLERRDWLASNAFWDQPEEAVCSVGRMASGNPQITP